MMSKLSYSALLPLVLACSGGVEDDLDASEAVDGDDTGSEFSSSTGGAEALGGQTSSGGAPFTPIEPPVETATGGMATGGGTAEPPAVPGADPDCESGIRNGAGNVCCLLSCGTCGGTGCEQRDGGNAGCCAGSILSSGVTCEDASAPCSLAGGTTEPPVDPPSVFAPQGACKLVIDEDFSGYAGANQTYTEATMKADFGATQGPYKGLDGRTQVGSSSIRASFPEGIILGQDTGFTWFSTLPANVDEAIMTYDVKFEDGFDWTKGGKLPGMCGGTCPRGCTNDVDGGFSMRLMWQRDAGMITYPYWPAQDGEQHCGGNWGWSKKAVAGKWHKIRQHIKLNTVGQSDGKIRLYLDGELVQSRDDIRYRNSANVTIDKAYWTTYVGGSSVADFAPDHDQFIWFDSFKVWVGCSE